MKTEAKRIELQYPLYLDVPMIVSFLAALENGVSYEENVQRRAGGTRSIGAEGNAGLNLPSLLGFLPIDLRGRLAGEVASEESEELQLVRRHTEASLFNRLRHILRELDYIRSLDADGSADTEIGSGQIIEVSGKVLRNPLDELLAFGERLFSFTDVDSRRKTPASDSNRQGGRPKSNQSIQTGVANPSDPRAIIDLVREDLKKSDMMDIVLDIQHPEFARCILP